MTRMFVAAYPPREAIEDLDDFLEPRREAGDFRWSATDQIHLTLAFLADVPDRALDELVDRLAHVAGRRRAMTASIAGGGVFPRVDFAKILWVGLHVDEPAELARLAANGRSAAAKAGAAPSGERFRPHLTIARIRRPIEATKWVRLLDSYRGPAWQLDQIALVASHLGEGPRKRPRHEMVETFALTPRQKLD
jgi:2'-5' RNA ligase